MTVEVIVSEFNGKGVALRLKSIDAARRYAERYVGKAPMVRAGVYPDGYAASADGACTVWIKGAAITDLFPIVAKDVRFILCEACGSEGKIYTSRWGGNDPDVWAIGDCETCEGTGTMEVEVERVERDDDLATGARP